jgi:hypothetical protein
MATKIVFDQEQGTAFIRRWGHIAPGEMQKGTLDLEAHPLFKTITKSLSDASEADFSEISSDELESHAEYCAPRLRHIKIAIIAPSDLLYGLARRFAILSEKENILVTKDMNQALAWLEVTLPEDF